MDIIDSEPDECSYCHYHCITDEWVYTCESCGQESCPDCSGRCGCPVGDEEAEAG